MKQITINHDKYKEALNIKIRYQDLTDEYKKLGEIINQARARRCKISMEKDKLFNDLSKKLEELDQ